MKTSKYRLPLNLQFFAEDGGHGEGGNDSGTDNKPSYEELAKQLASAKADAERWKAASDKNSSQVAEYKKQLREYMSEEQRKEAERKDADEANAKELNDLRNEVAKIRAVEKFRKLGMSEELAQTAADAEVNGDSDKVAECYEKHVKAVEANAYQKFLDERKDPASGRGKGGSDEEDTATKLAKQAADRRGTADGDIIKNYLL